MKKRNLIAWTVTLSIFLLLFAVSRLSDLHLNLL